MISFTHVMNNAKSFFGINLAKEHCTPKNLVAVFKEHLGDFSALYISQDECIENCIKAIKDNCEFENGNISETNRKIFAEYLEIFNKSVNESPYSSIKDESEKLKIAFNKSLCKIIEQKWAHFMAKSFYQMLSIADKKEQAIDAQIWTGQYYLGVDYFSEWESWPIDNELVIKLEQKTLSAFQTYCRDLIQKKMKTMLARAERDPMSFQKGMLEAMTIREKDPASFSASEAECVTFLQDLSNGIAPYSPDIEKKMALLKECIWHGFAIRKLNQSFDNKSLHLFESTFETIP